MVELSIPLPRDTFQVISDCGIPVLGKTGKWTVKHLTDWNRAIGDDWYFRIAHRFGDFCYVGNGSLVLWLTVKPPLQEFVRSNGTLTANYAHRGFAVEVCFVKGLGNKLDLATFAIL